MFELVAHMCKVATTVHISLVVSYCRVANTRLAGMEGLVHSATSYYPSMLLSMESPHYSKCQCKLLW